MRKILFSIAALASTASLYAAKVDIVPAPKVLVESSGEFRAAGAPVAVSSAAAAAATDLAASFAADLTASSGKESRVNAFSGRTPAKGIVFDFDADLAAEAYTLDVTPGKVLVKASSTSGFFYAVQSLKQLLPVAIYTGVRDAESSWTIPCVHIEDAPAFAYRGLHLDCCRHFFSIDEVKKILNLMSMYKINTLHWHLTDDQGWRIESKLYPRLTEVGSIRKGTQIGYDRYSCDNVPYGGFYTQEQVKEVIEYAARRSITIIPEVDLPGHMLAALTAYPELGCTDGPYELWTRWGISTQVLNPAKPATMDFLKNVCGEIADLFPGKYFHIGGDECPKGEWKNDPLCQKLIAELGYVDDKNATKEQRLQNWVTAQMQEYLASKGKEVIGWDEILEGDLKEGAVVMCWRGPQHGIKAAQKGFDVIMTPNQYLYFDFVQSPRIEKEPLSITTQAQRYVSWEKVYSFNPFDQLNEEQSKHIIGVQANVWTEYISTEDHLEYMIIPRIFALSELQWSPVSTRSEERLRNSMASHQLPIMASLGYNYRPLDNVFEKPAPAGENVLRLLYWNIQNGMWADQGNNYDNFVNWVKSYDPDICVWCEAASNYKTADKARLEEGGRYLPSGWKELAGRYGHKYVFLGCHRDNFPQVITSKYPIEEVARICGSQPDSVVTHGSGWAKIRYAGQTINIVTVHTWPQKFAFGVPKEERKASAERREGDQYRCKEVKYICEHTILSGEGAGEQNWIMLGDFNSKSRIDRPIYNMQQDDGYTFLCQDWIAEHTPYIDILSKHTGDRQISSTYTRDRIDYIYITEPLARRVKEAYYIADEWTLPHSTHISQFKTPSDHRPACLELKF